MNKTSKIDVIEPTNPNVPVAKQLELFRDFFNNLKLIHKLTLEQLIYFLNMSLDAIISV